MFKVSEVPWVTQCFSEKKVASQYLGISIPTEKVTTDLLLKIEKQTWEGSVRPASNLSTYQEKKIKKPALKKET